MGRTPTQKKESDFLLVLKILGIIVASIIIISLLILNIFSGSYREKFLTREQISEKSLIEKGFTNPLVNVYNASEMGEVFAMATVEHWKKPHDRHVSTAIHPLYWNFPEATKYSIIVVIGGHDCTFIVDANDYRLWRDYGDYEAGLRWKEDIENTGTDCKE